MTVTTAMSEAKPREGGRVLADQLQLHVATSGRPGPVVLSLPEDMLSATVTVADALPYRAVQPQASTAAVEAACARLRSAERPLLIVGGGGFDATAAEDLRAFAAAHDLPVVASFRRQEYLDNADPHYVGDLGLGPNPALVERIRAADLLLLLGARMGDVNSRGYSLLEIPTPRQQVIHVHADSAELGKVFRPALAINASAASFLAEARALPPTPAPRWQMWTAAAGQDYRAWLRPLAGPGELQLAEIVAWLRQALPPEAIVTN